MDTSLLDQAIEEAKAFQISKGRSPERAARLAQTAVEDAVSWIGSSNRSTFSAEEKIAEKASFFETIGVSKNTARRLATSM